MEGVRQAIRTCDARVHTSSWSLCANGKACADNDQLMTLTYLFYAFTHKQFLFINFCLGLLRGSVINTFQQRFIVKVQWTALWIWNDILILGVYWSIYLDICTVRPLVRLKWYYFFNLKTGGLTGIHSISLAYRHLFFIILISIWYIKCAPQTYCSLDFIFVSE